jgi:hypothetical protein
MPTTLLLRMPVANLPFSIPSFSSGLVRSTLLGRACPRKAPCRGTLTSSTSQSYTPQLQHNRSSTGSCGIGMGRPCFHRPGPSRSSPHFNCISKSYFQITIAITLQPFPFLQLHTTLPIHVYAEPPIVSILPRPLYTPWSMRPSRKHTIHTRIALYSILTTSYTSCRVLILCVHTLPLPCLYTPRPPAPIRISHTVYAGPGAYSDTERFVKMALRREYIWVDGVLVS